MFRRMRLWVGLLLVMAACPLAQAQPGETDLLHKQLKETSDRFERLLREQRETIDQLNRRIETLEKERGSSSAIATNDSLAAALAADAQRKTEAEQGGSNPATSSNSWTPTSPIRVGGAGQNYINLSFDALFAAGTSPARDIERLQPGAHDPNQRGFTVQNLEPTFEGKVDPYFRGLATISMQLSPAGETSIEAEEAYVETMGLPGNLQLRAGMFFTEFGRINPTHAHTWDFVDSPLISTRMFGAEGFCNSGIRLSWLAPTPFYSELFFTVQKAEGATAYGFDDDLDREPLFGRNLTERGVHSLADLL